MSHEIIGTKTYLLGIDLEQPFPLGFGTLDKLPRVLYTIRTLEKSRVVEGIGEASIDFPFSTYDAWDIYHALSNLEIAGEHIENRESLLKNQQIRNQLLNHFPAAFTAFNMALDDLFGKLEGQSILDIYRQKRPSGRALASISYKDDVSLLLVEIQDKFRVGFIPKPKVGRGITQDAETIRAISIVSKSKQIPFVLDFNAHYNTEEFSNLVSLLLDSGIDLSFLLFLEQPTKEEEGVEGLVCAKKILERCGYNIPVMADETFVTLEEAVACSKAGISLNFKIHKIGGLYRAVEIEKALAEEGKRKTDNMVGGSFPTAIGRTYDQQAAATLDTTTLPGDGWEPSTDWFKKNKHLIDESFRFDVETQSFLPTRGIGLGITPQWKKILNFVVPNPKKEYQEIRLGGSGEHIKIDLINNQQYGDSYFKRSGRKPDWNL